MSLSFCFQDNLSSSRSSRQDLNSNNEVALDIGSIAAAGEKCIEKVVMTTGEFNLKLESFTLEEGKLEKKPLIFLWISLTFAYLQPVNLRYTPYYISTMEMGSF